MPPTLAWKARRNRPRPGRPTLLGSARENCYLRHTISGTTRYWTVGAEPALGTPAAPEDTHVVMTGALQQRYVAEFVFPVPAHVAESNDG